MGIGYKSIAIFKLQSSSVEVDKVKNLHHSCDNDPYTYPSNDQNLLIVICKYQPSGDTNYSKNLFGIYSILGE
jgi:hypothetical protein